MLLYVTFFFAQNKFDGIILLLANSVYCNLLSKKGGKMNNNKLETITNLFEGAQIRSVWDNNKEDYYFSVVDVISALTGSSNPRDYWFKLKIRMTEEEKSELSTKCRRLKMKAQDGKFRETDTLDTKGILRLIESVPSPKAEPFKLWLASLGSEYLMKYLIQKEL